MSVGELRAAVRAREVKLGTLHAVFSQAVRFIPEADLRQHFYSD